MAPSRNFRPPQPPLSRSMNVIPSLPPLQEATLDRDPFRLFEAWFEEARRSSGQRDPHAMHLATVGEDGFPQGRIVLLKGFDPRGFVFFTNAESDKGRALESHPRTALTFHWDRLGRQVRIVGAVERIAATESDAYFRSRPRGSRVGAWASAQSRPLADRASLLARVREYEARFGEGEIPRPPHWGGYRVTPRSIEFWQEGEDRLHDRFRFVRGADGWSPQRLNP